MLSRFFGYNIYKLERARKELNPQFQLWRLMVYR